MPQLTLIVCRGIMGIGRRRYAAGRCAGDKVDHRAPRSRPLDSEGEFQFGDLSRRYECPPCILVTNRSPDSISRLKQSSARPGLMPELVGLRPAYPIVADTG